MPFTPLTEEQFNRARQAGYSTEQIISFEKRRKAESDTTSGQNDKFNIPDIPLGHPLVNLKNVAAFGKGLYEGIPKPIRNISQVAMSPMGLIDVLRGRNPIEQAKVREQGASEIVAKIPTETLPTKIAYGAGYITPDILAAKGVGSLKATGKIIPKVLSKIPTQLGLRTSALPSLGYGTYEAGKKVLEGKPGEAIPTLAGSTALGLGLGAVGNITFKAGKLLNPKTISKIRDYPADKVNAVRKSWWNSYAPQEYKSYGDSIENLSKEGSGIINDGAGLIQNLEKKLVNRGLMNQEGELLKPLTQADSKFIKSYQSISRKWANSKDGSLRISDLVSEYKNIKGSYSAKPTLNQRNDTAAANDFFDSGADYINVKSFSEAKARYRIFKQNEQMIHEAIDLYAPEMKTAKGERWLMEGSIGGTAQGRKTANLITEKTGQTLRAAKAYSFMNRVPLLKAITKSR